jgi:hypothetical protein
LGTLAGEVLGVGRDASIAVSKSRREYASEICIKKAQFNQDLGFDPNILTSAHQAGAMIPTKLRRSARGDQGV